MNVSQALKAVSHGDYLTQAQAEATLGDIVEGAPSSLQVAALLGALRARGESADEITGFVRALHARVIPVVAQSSDLIDTCGTGGDSPKQLLGTFNISTAASLVAAAAGARIAKHGNRAVSSKCGSADVLKALGVSLNLTPEAIGRCIDEVGIGFMFAPNHHPALKNVAPLRRELGIRTIFNLAAPLANPASTKRQVMGVPAAKWLRPVAQTLLELGCQRAFVAHSEDGLDEFSTCAPTHYIEVRDGALHEDIFDPHAGGVACINAQMLQGGDAQENAVIIQQVLHDGEGPSADITCLNAAAILIVADIVPDFDEGIKLARATIRAGAAREKLQRLREFTEIYGNAI